MSHSTSGGICRCIKFEVTVYLDRPLTEDEQTAAHEAVIDAMPKDAEVSVSSAISHRISPAIDQNQAPRIKRTSA